MNKLLDVLKGLDVDNVNHWTSDGQPRLDVIKELVGEDISRADIKEIAPKFCRKNTSLTPPEPETTNPWSQGSVIDEDSELLEDGLPSVEEEMDNPHVQGPSPSEVSLAEERYNKAVVAFDQARINLDEARRQYDIVKQAEEEAKGQQTFADTVAAYHASQKQVRAEKAARKRALVDAIGKDNLKILAPQPHVKR